MNSIVSPLLTDPFHAGVSETVIGLSRVATPTTDRGEDHKPIQALAALLPCHGIQVHRALNFRFSDLLEIFLAEVVQESVPEDHGKMEDTANFTHLLRVVDECTGSLHCGDVMFGYLDVDSLLSPLADAAGLVAGFHSRARGKDDLHGSMVDQPLGQFQPEAPKTPRDDVGLSRVAHGLG